MKTSNTLPEQELQPTSLHHFGIDRRKFFKMLGGGVAITFFISDSVSKQLVGETMFGDIVDESSISAWIHVGESNIVTVYTGKVEVGQNIRTSLAQIVAEELHVAVDAIEMVMGDTDLTPYARGTFGSLSTPIMGPILRQAAASARELLLDMAAKEWKVNKTTLVAEDGKIKNLKSKRSVPFGDIAKGKKLIQGVDKNIPTIPPDKWKIAGTPVLKVNGTSFVTGKHKYASDLKMPGMMYGKILRPPVYEASLESVDVSAAEALPGVTVVVDKDFVGVVAADTATAEKALAVIKDKWKMIPKPSRNEIFDFLVKNAEGGRGDTKGNVNEAFGNAPINVEETVHVDYIAHVPLEPRGAVAEWKDGKVTVWTGTQRPFGVQEELMNAFHIAKEQTRVIVPDTGSGYGGKHTGDAAIEAARLAKAVNKPVKVVWTREEEFKWAYFRPAGVITIKAGCTKEGVLSSWEFHNYNSGGSGIDTPYDVANQEIKYHPVKSPLRQGSYRGLAGTANIFARECIMDDLAEKVNMDPLAFRLKNLSFVRLRDVLVAAAEKFNWKDNQTEKGRGYGIACGDEKGSVIAACAEVVQVNDSYRVERIVVAFECGAIINPSNVENQIVGSVVQGIGGALFERIDFKDGKILNPALSSYRVPRFSDVPIIEVVVLNKKEIPSVGAGETPIFAVAPAIRNAIANASGKRLYKLPMLD